MLRRCSTSVLSLAEESRGMYVRDVLGFSVSSIPTSPMPGAVRRIRESIVRLSGWVIDSGGEVVFLVNDILTIVPARDSAGSGRGFWRRRRSGLLAAADCM